MTYWGRLANPLENSAFEQVCSQQVRHAGGPLGGDVVGGQQKGALSGSQGGFEEEVGLSKAQKKWKICIEGKGRLF